MRTFQRMTQQERALENQANNLLGLRKRVLSTRQVIAILGEPEVTLTAQEREANRLWLQSQVTIK